MPKAGLLSAFAGLIGFVPKRVHTFTEQVWLDKTGFSRKFYIFVDKLIVLLCSKCLTDSPSQSKLLAENGVTDKGKPLAYLGQGSLSGVDLSKFNLDLKMMRHCEKNWVSGLKILYSFTWQGSL